MIEHLPRLAVLLAAAYILVLGLLALFQPALASRFLLGFATSAGTHYAELLVRLVLGVSFLAVATGTRMPRAFQGAGGLLVVTALGLTLVLWRWHAAFAARSVPEALKHRRVIGVASLAMGGFIAWPA
ncbi:MAG: hypothetical protein ACRC2H_09700 [Silanimonas sp.]